MSALSSQLSVKAGFSESVFANTPPKRSLDGAPGFGYDNLSRRTSLTRPNGITTSYTYDPVSNLLSTLHKLGTTTLDGASYTYDSANNRKTKTDKRLSTTLTYAYDNIYELLSAKQGSTTKETYTYDLVGNRLSSLGVSPYSYNPSNELTATPSATYTYDANGNTLSDPSGKQYTWDFENRLTQVIVPGTGTVAFKYDPFGRRIQKSGSLGTTNYLYDGINLAAEVDSAGNLQVRYTQGPNVDEPIAELRSGSTSYYEPDGLGSVTSLSSPSGTIQSTYAYDSFGNLSSTTGATTNPYRYTSREFDSETELFYYRLRYYQPRAGRFLSEDPLTFGGGNNFYVYVRNNPIVLIDPFGLRPPTEQEIQDLINAAQDWANSNVPYMYGRKSKKGADCSGSVWAIYGQGGLPYDYTTASGLPKNPRFVPVPPGSQQPGDVGWCPNHIVIYDPNAGQQRNVWSASHTGGPAFGPGNSSWYCHDMKWYRYDVPEECHSNSCSKGKQ